MLHINETGGDKVKALIFLLVILALIVGCSKEPTKEETTRYGRIKVEAFDTPPPLGLERIDLTITEVSIHKSGEGWITVDQPNITHDFLKLINGATAVLVDDTLQPGHYTQMRLVVADTNKVVVEGETYPLFVPSGEQTGVKLNLDFTMEVDELIEIYVDFDASKSIKWVPGLGQYRMRPTFKAFKKLLSGTVAGSVQDTAGVGIVNALVEAIASNDTTATVTNSTGAYKLILLEGMYDLKASAEGYTTADTFYTGVEVNAGVNLMGYNFILRQ